MDVQADLAIRSGYLCLRRIATFFRIQYDPTRRPATRSASTASASIGRSTCSRRPACPLVEDRDQAWRDFSGWRVNYDTVLRALERLTMAPTPWWELPMRSAFETERPWERGARARAGGRPPQALKAKPVATTTRGDA